VSRPFSRRDLLRTAILAPLTVDVFRSRASALPAIRRVGGPYLKPALNVFSFLEPLNANLKGPGTGIDLFGVCDFAAKMNIDAVDLTGYFFPGYPKVPEDRYVNRIKRHAHHLGVDISGTGIRNDFATADKSVRAAGVQLTRDWIEVAARLGAPTIRVFAGPQAPYRDWQTASGNADRETVERWMSDAVRECAEHGEKFGVQVAVQNHGDFLKTGPEHTSLLQRVDHEWCGAMVDTGYYLTDDPYADIRMVVPWALNWQIKETLGSSLSSPRADYRKLIQIIHDGGYRGYVPIETLAMGRRDYDPAAEVTKVLAQVREAIAAVR
jgi:sugar phosphate isomerase/epimerase